MDFGTFTIEAPVSWYQFKEGGMDSYIGGIAVDETDTLYFDLGWYSNTLTETEIEVITKEMIEENLNDSADYTVIKNDNTIDNDKFRKQNVNWTIIDNKRAKIVYPRISGKGRTGVYFNNLWVTESDNDRFNLNGNNLKQKNERELLKLLTL